MSFDQRVGKHDAPETQTVLGLTLRAEELKCDALVFVRDRDRDEQREQDIEAGITAAKGRFEIRIVGGTANEEIEAWLLALLGDKRAESYPDPKRVLRATHGVEQRRQKVEVVGRLDPMKLPPGCSSLARWVERAQEAFAHESGR